MIWSGVQVALAFAKRLPWQVWAIAGALALLLVAWLWHSDTVEDAAEEGRQEGAKQQRETDLVETINRTEQANETRDTIQNEVRTGTGGNLYAQCLRTARTPANCERFLPRGETADR